MREPETSPDLPGPLSGITVLDLSNYIAGPYGCTLLADFGAKVIKVEPPGGDNLRRYPSTLEQESRAFLGVNRSKFGIVLDLKKPGGRSALMRMVAASDVVVHNFRPSVPPRLGITYEECRAVNRQIVYCALTGFGDRGPLKDKAGYDQVLQSMTGICTFQGEETSGPSIVYGSVVDFNAASLLAGSIAAALFHRQRSGEGQYISVSLLRTALAMQSARFIWANNEPRKLNRDMRSGGITGIHPAREGYLYLSANTPHFWKALCELVGLAELASNPRYDTIRKRSQNAAEIVSTIRLALRKKTATEWEEIFGDQVPCSVVRPIEDMFDHPQVIADDIVAEFDHPVIGSYRGMGPPIRFGSLPGPRPFAPPVLGADSLKILDAFGFSDSEIRVLQKQGVIPPTEQKGG